MAAQAESPMSSHSASEEMAEVPPTSDVGRRRGRSAQQQQQRNEPGVNDGSSAPNAAVPGSRSTKEGRKRSRAKGGKDEEVEEEEEEVVEEEEEEVVAVKKSRRISARKAASENGGGKGGKSKAVVKKRGPGTGMDTGAGEEMEASKSNKRRKSSSPAPKVAAEASPSKTKVAFIWTKGHELSLATMLWNDKKHGRPIPTNKSDPYWVELAKEWKNEGVSVSGSQLCEKVRRMKKKWSGFKEDEQRRPGKDTHEQKLFMIWDAIWGTASENEKRTVRAQTPQAGGSEQDEEDSSGEDEPSIHGLASPAAGEIGRDEEMVESGGSAEGGKKREGETAANEIASPFVSKPRLVHTPMPNGNLKKSVRDPKVGTQEHELVSSRLELQQVMETVRRDSLETLNQVRTSCLSMVDDVRKYVAAQLNCPASSSMRLSLGTLNFFDNFLGDCLDFEVDGANVEVTQESRDRMLQLRVEAMDVRQKILQMRMEQLKVAKDELKKQMRN